MKIKKSTILFLIAMLAAGAGVFIKLKVDKTIGDIFLIVSTVSFYYFAYTALRKNKQLKKRAEPTYR